MDGRLRNTRVEEVPSSEARGLRSRSFFPISVVDMFGTMIGKDFFSFHFVSIRSGITRR